MVKILGINAFHADASAALIVDGKIVNAIEEERFLRIKHCAGFPIESIKWSLKDAKIDLTSKNIRFCGAILPDGSVSPLCE